MTDFAGYDPEWRSMVLDQVYDGVYTTDPARRITYWNQAAERITGYTRDEVVGTRCSDNLLRHIDEQGRSLCQQFCPMSATMADGGPREARVFLHHKEGHRVPVWVRTAPLRNRAGQIVGGVEVFTADNLRLSLEEKVERLRKAAMLDTLTELPNRRFLEERLEDALQEMGFAGWPLTIMLIDVDLFKGINDQHGHLVGDSVLRTVARTLQNGLREPDTVGRWGGDEFLTIAQSLSIADLPTVAARLCALVAGSTMTLDGLPTGVTVSIGATMAREGETATELLARADALLYEAKAAGRNQARWSMGPA